MMAMTLPWKKEVDPKTRMITNSEVRNFWRETTAMVVVFPCR